MAIYKPSLLDKFKDFVNGLKGNWDQYEAHVADFDAHLDQYEAHVADFEAHQADFNSHLAESATDDVHGLANAVIVESGSNANGTYIKFGDGTLICRVSNFRMTNFTANRLRRTWDYPEPFIEPPTVTVTFLGSNKNVIVDMGGKIITVVQSKTNISCFPHVWNTAFSEGDYVDVDIMAIGRWK